MSSPQYTPYKDALSNAMKLLSEKEDSVFIGQQVLWHGNPMSTTIGDVPKDKADGDASKETPGDDNSADKGNSSESSDGAGSSSGSEGSNSQKENEL